MRGCWQIIWSAESKQTITTIKKSKVLIKLKIIVNIKKLLVLLSLKCKMASSENSNLVTEFEQAYAEALATLCEEDPLCDKSAIEDQKIVKTF